MGADTAGVSGEMGADKKFSFLKKMYWSRVDLQCCVSFRCTAK